MFPMMSRKFNVAHVVHTYGVSVQASDEEIYQKAVLEDRFVLTINYKDFKKLVEKNKPGIFGLESQLTNEQIDKLVTNFLSRRDPVDYIGKATRISGSWFSDQPVI